MDSAAKMSGLLQKSQGTLQKSQGSPIRAREETGKTRKKSAAVDKCCGHGRSGAARRRAVALRAYGACVEPAALRALSPPFGLPSLAPPHRWRDAARFACHSLSAPPLCCASAARGETTDRATRCAPCPTPQGVALPDPRGEASPLPRVIHHGGAGTPRPCP